MHNIFILTLYLAIFDILSGMYFDVLSDILFGIYSDILSGILWHSFWHSIWHLFWHSIWHLLNHLFWHSFWHMFFSLTFYLAYVYGISSDIFSGIISDMSSQLLCGRGPARITFIQRLLFRSRPPWECDRCWGSIEGIQFQKPTLMWYTRMCLTMRRTCRCSRIKGEPISCVHGNHSILSFDERKGCLHHPFLKMIPMAEFFDVIRTPIFS